MSTSRAVLAALFIFAASSPASARRLPSNVVRLAAGEGGDASLFQERAGASEAREVEEPDVNISAMWHQLRGAVQIDALRQHLQQLPGIEAVQSLQREIAELQAEHLDADRIKAQLASQWEEVVHAVRLENVSEALAQARANHSEEIEALQEQYNALRSEIPNMTLQEAQTKAAEAWTQLREEHLHPHLDELERRAHDALNESVTSAKAALGSAKAKVTDALDAVQRALLNLWR